RVSARGNHQRRVRVPEIVEAERRELSTPHGGAEDAGHEVVRAPDVAVRRREYEPQLVRCTGEQLLAQDAERFTGEANAPPAGGGFRRDDLPLARAGFDRERGVLEVECPVTEGEQLAL